MDSKCKYENSTKEDLLKELKEKDNEIWRLKQELIEAKNGRKLIMPTAVKRDENPSEFIFPSTSSRLSKEEIARYSRQLILPEIGPEGQKRLSKSSVLVVGCGGLGCPSAIYLAAAGVGCIGLVDYDVVEVSNLHRQVLHTEARIGVSKAVSLSTAIQDLNGHVRVVTHIEALTTATALDIMKEYDIVLDCTDNVATRYLLNDACVFLEKPLVSGSALRFEGQLTVYHYDGGPCYRCLYPKPPLPETVTNCSDGGVLGAVPGLIGCLQAVEAVKVICQVGSPFSERMMIYDGLSGRFHVVKLRKRSKNCNVCGEAPSITKLINYEQFCGAAATDKEGTIGLLSPDQRMNVEEYKQMLDSKVPHVLIDVRTSVETEICSLPNFVNIPIKDIMKDSSISTLKTLQDQNGPMQFICICRRGNDSQIAVQKLEGVLGEGAQIKDIKGGLHAWAQKIDQDFPVY
ncbi:ubiquitin-like activating enzyme 4 [Oratosquilla oratoria]|uniref:ubiquitin-like activating enzyme 4 n=1 Tax=Oratosquilla oratoria TaxID=337810 RepID=UPI003F76F6CE